ncbi:hypothetical protein NRK68_25320 [Streptomyces yangpuensis]|uniref:Uncharacterized protein n=1 Tax=Streptomyces yangpuensis TaxID=1648182 RepID=A0ABY5Q1X0_9ACTN|nr:hypothetical protein [Streptomyces yangpuensis]UUY50250.1 hypothetical protein NRK68_25320 [Streptomyces yangpuensis]
MRTSLRIPAVSALALTVGALWWWAVLRLVLAPEESGVVEGAVAVGGWSLGLLPVHCVPAPLRGVRRRAGRDAREAGDGGGGGGGPEPGDGPEPGGGAVRAAGAPGPADAATRASTPRRSDAGSGPS